MDIIDLTETLPHKPYVRRRADVLEYIVWHHSAGPATQSPSQLAAYHLSKGWSGLGYTYLVYENGAIFKVRPITAIPACVQGQNTKSICICFVGDFENDEPTDGALKSGAWLTNLLLSNYPSIKGVRGHGEMAGQATACPGKHLKFSLEQARISAGWAA